MTKSKTINDLIADVEEATKYLDNKVRELNDASAREIAARNTLNQAQKALDEHMAAMRKHAPKGSHWWTQEHRKQTPLDSYGI